MLPAPLQHQPESGFSLLEVMVALAILALAAFPLLQICNDSIDDASLTQRMRLAKDLATRKLNQVRLGDPQVTDGSAGDFTEWERRVGEFEGFSWEVTIVTEGDSLMGSDEEMGEDGAGEGNSGPTDTPEQLEEELPLILKRVEVVLVYPYFDGEREYRLETYIYLPQDEEDLEEDPIR